MNATKLLRFTSTIGVSTAGGPGNLHAIQTFHRTNALVPPALNIALKGTYQADEYDLLPLEALTRLTEIGGRCVLVHADATASAIEKLRNDIAPEVSCETLRFDAARTLYPGLDRLREPSPDDLHSTEEAVDCCVVVQRKSKERTRYILRALRERYPTARLLLAGHKKRGIKSAGRYLRESFDEIHSLGSANHCQLVELGSSVQASREVEQGFTWRDVSYRCSPGVFGARGLDAASRRLLETIDTPQDGARLLDIGAGAGVLGLSQLAQTKNAHLVATDTDWLAVADCRHNAEKSGMGERVVAIWADALPYEEVIGDGFDRIVSNPPFHSGTRTSYAVAELMIGRAGELLRPGGDLWIVANRFLPYPDMLDASPLQWERPFMDQKFTVYRGVLPGGAS